MLLTKQNLAEAKPPAEPPKIHWDVLPKDLRFFASVTLARYIVWRTLRRRNKENSARRRKLKLLRGEDSLAQAQPQVMRGSDWRASAVAIGKQVLRQSGR